MRRTFATLCLLWFPGAAVAADIQPVSGLWSGEVVFDSRTDCPVAIVVPLKSKVQGYSNHQITFPDLFDPTIFQNVEPPVAWQKTGHNVWEGVSSVTHKTGSGALTIASTSMMAIVTPDQIDQRTQVTVKFPPNLAQRAGIPATGCVLLWSVYHKRARR
ncbi:hypothetical protein [uncultured Roseobacter sp.]|uniref:hypothetical protein n=1 Tax=uncultured Roseobacter sp. TaxID=114847 RepID=UPI002632F009|nr:hypothetical protein [uncultured Roseobacter sp.]